MCSLHKPASHQNIPKVHPVSSQLSTRHGPLSWMEIRAEFAINLTLHDMPSAREPSRVISHRKQASFLEHRVCACTQCSVNPRGCPAFRPCTLERQGHAVDRVCMGSLPCQAYLTSSGVPCLPVVFLPRQVSFAYRSEPAVGAPGQTKYLRQKSSSGSKPGMVTAGVS